ncbi:N-acetylmuramoyl-L-alanine amidase [Bacillus sp. C30]|uniref:N-acetylmuramoyl-L-alanine amidase n=1 Tax=Bacillus sp. C30 TaxID=1387733 RepID=UPI00349F2410
MRYSLHGGHTEFVQGANCGGRKEHIMDRLVKDAVAAKLRVLGHTVYDDTDEVGGTQSQNLNNIVRNCNSHDADLVISFHLNAYNGTANGVEVCYYDQQSLAAKVSAQLSKDIGWPNRGAKERKELYVLANTKAPAILIELGFIDNESDMAKWNVDKIANSIVYALTRQTVGNVSKPTEPVNNGVRVKTGGFSDQEAAKEILEYALARKWWVEPFVNNGEFYYITGGLYEPQLSEFEKWMKENGWWCTRV